MSGPGPAGAPPRAFSVLSGVALGVVVYFAVKILLVRPGNLLALACLVLMGLSLGAVARRGGVRSFASLVALGAAALGGLLALVLGRA